MPNGLKNVQLVKVGKWKASTGDHEFTSGDLEDIVCSFRELNSQQGFRPHLKLGHGEAQKYFGQRTGFPSLGEVTRVWRDGEYVYGDIDNVPAPLLDLIQKRRYTQLSIELYPEYSHDGKTYRNVLVGVALLGAELPAVKGLADLAASLFKEDPALFAEAKGMLELSEMATPADDKSKDAEIAALKARAEAAEKAAAENKTALEAAQSANTVLIGRVDAIENAGRTTAAEAAVDAAITAGKLLPKQRDAALALAAALDIKTLKFTFGEGDAKAEKTGIAVFAQFLSDLSPVVKLNERGLSAAEDERDAKDGESASSKLTAMAQKLVADGKKKDFAEAFATVLADPANAELKNAYALGR